MPCSAWRSARTNALSCLGLTIGAAASDRESVIVE